jgi:hypothetical protein
MYIYLYYADNKLEKQMEMKYICNVENLIINKMKQFKAIMIAALMAVMAISLSSCLGDDDNTTNLGDPDEALATGLVGTWQLASKSGVAVTDTTQVEYYKFSSDGTGSMKKYEEGAWSSYPFVWVSYYTKMVYFSYTSTTATIGAFYYFSNGLLNFWDGSNSGNYSTFMKIDDE